MRRTRGAVWRLRQTMTFHRVIQWPAQGRMPEPALVHEPRRCEGKAGGLAWRLQHGKTPQRDREQAPDYADESPRRNQPAKVRKRQKLQPRIRAILGAVQKGSDSRNKRGTLGAQVSFFGYRAGVQTAEGDEPATLSIIEARRFLLFF